MPLAEMKCYSERLKCDKQLALVQSVLLPSRFISVHLFFFSYLLSQFSLVFVLPPLILFSYTSLTAYLLFIEAAALFALIPIKYYHQCVSAYVHVSLKAFPEDSPEQKFILFEAATEKTMLKLFSARIRLQWKAIFHTDLEAR